MSKITSLSEALSYAMEIRRNYPNRDALAARQAAINGKCRQYPVISITHQNRTDDDFIPEGEFELPEVIMPDTQEGKLSQRLSNLFTPLQLLNPFHLQFSTCKGPGTYTTMFGIPLNPEAANSPAYTKTIDQVLSEPWPELGKTGLMPEIAADIKLIKDNLPPEIKIAMPDTQGPYNVLHSLVGEEAMLAPYMEPNKYHELMNRLTDLWIASTQLCMDLIGPEYLDQFEKDVRLAECSANLVSPEFYEEFILPYDLRVANHFGNRVRLHPCSGPHVFHGTLKHLPLVWTEAGYIERTAAGAIAVTEALKAIGDRPVTLGIGQELPKGQEFEFIKNDLDFYEKNPRLLFSYTGMDWHKEDREMIRDLHCRLDNYWEEKFFNS